MDLSNLVKILLSYKDGIVQSLIAGVILLICPFYIKKFYNKIPLRFLNSHFYAEFASYLLLLLASFVFYLNNSGSLSDKASFVTVTCLIFSSVAIKMIHFRKLRKLGIIAIDKEMQTGTTVEKALDMVNRNLDFIGVGADKLLKSSSFKPAVRRCIKNGGKIQLILCDPDSPALIDMARAAEIQDIEEYRETVLAAHKTIERMIVEKKWPISLFIYQAKSIKQLPVFRLMVIDKKTYVSSYSVYGLGDKASQLPQLICYKSGQSENEYKTFSHAFENFKKYMIDSSALKEFERVE